ncbi:MAG: DNA polymerase III subunit alpha, partial [Acidobacteria bacterium]|nr:DNA polymerase III subunit alpha [Acidobacteriota bacterium]
MGAAAVETFIESRAGVVDAVGSIEQLCRVTDMSGLASKTLESVVKAGAFDRFGDRGAILASAGRIHTLAQSEASLKLSDQASMFDLFGDSVPVPMPELDLGQAEVSQNERLQWQKELLGVYLE